MLKTKRLQTVGLVLLGLASLLGAFYFVTGKSFAPINKACVNKDLSTCRVKTGIVTRITPNCGTAVELIDGKEVVDKVSSNLCDGGSFMKIDDLGVQTATGLVASGFFEKDVSTIELGDKVTVKYVENKEGRATLNCDACGVYK